MKSIVLIAVMFLTLNGFSQNILDFFVQLPDSSILGLTKSERENIVKYSSDNKNSEDAFSDIQKYGFYYSFEIVDVANGYLRITGYMEGKMEMCYWKLLDGNKLIAIYHEGCGPVCYVEQMDFYLFNGENFIYQNINEIIPKDLYKEFFISDVEKIEKELEEKDIIFMYLYQIPRFGKNVIIKMDNFDDDIETSKKYLKGNRMELLWNNGKFTKGKIFWE